MTADLIGEQKDYTETEQSFMASGGVRPAPHWNVPVEGATSDERG